MMMKRFVREFRCLTHTKKLNAWKQNLSRNPDTMCKHFVYGKFTIKNFLDLINKQTCITTFSGEADWILKHVSKLMANPKTVGQSMAIITFYSAQKELILFKIKENYPDLHHVRTTFHSISVSEFLFVFFQYYCI